MSQPTVNSDALNQTDVPVEEVDLLVVGGGKAGKSLAMLRAKAGDKVVMVERDKVGGTCINVACIPTKTLISAARVLHEVQGSQAYGVTLPELPTGLVVLGGGVIGVEMASLMGLLGVPVTIVHAGEHILDREDEDVAAEVTAGLEALGVTVLAGAHASKVATATDGGGVVVTTDDGREATGSHLLVALGRTPVTAGLGLEATGVELTERGFVRVDDHLRTTAENVYAAGDVAGTPQFTHASWNDFRVLRDLFADKEASTTGRLIPWAVFTTPELGHVGLTETEARQAGYEVRVAKTPTAAVPRAKTLGRTEGFFKVVVDARTDLILGAAIIGAEASEVVTSIQMAMLGGLTWQQVRDAVITHPTMSEGLNIVLDSLG